MTEPRTVGRARLQDGVDGVGTRISLCLRKRDDCTITSRHYTRTRILPESREHQVVQAMRDGVFLGPPGTHGAEILFDHLHSTVWAQ